MVIYWLKDKKRIRILLLSGFLLLPFFLYAIPLEWLKDQHSVCLFKNLTGKECYGCGMTRAVLSVIHFQFENAIKFNKLVLIVFPLLVYLWIRNIVNLWPGKTI
jgi:hypothetical protein